MAQNTGRARAEGNNMEKERSPKEHLDAAFQRASANIFKTALNNLDVVNRVESICMSSENRSGSRFLLACLLAKAHNPKVDIRKPYTTLGDNAYSGRGYDEKYVSDFIFEHDLPCNGTTAFLTPTFRNKDIILTPDIDLIGKPPKLYKAILQLLTDVQNGVVTAEDLLVETIRWLLIFRNEKTRLKSRIIADPAPAIEKIAQADPSNIQAIAASHLEIGNSYYINMLRQSQQSFQWALIAAGIGLLFFFAAVIFLLVRQPTTLSYVSTFGGAVVEVIAGINFGLYRRASDQAAAYHVRLDRIQRFFIANSACENIEGDTKCSTRAELVKKLMS